MDFTAVLTAELAAAEDQIDELEAQLESAKNVIADLEAELADKR